MHLLRIGFLLLLIGKAAFAKQPPTYNPYENRYGSTEHWTRLIHWNRISNVLEVPGLLKGENRIDSLILQETIQKISAGGGAYCTSQLALIILLLI